MSKLITRASSINRALDQIGDKWCLLIIQELLWGINSFVEMQAATGVSKSVLVNRLHWLQSIDCIKRDTRGDNGKRAKYHLTKKSIELYDSGLMAVAWERRFFRTPELDRVKLIHRRCGKAFQPEMRCRSCEQEVHCADVRFKPGPGATQDERGKKVRRRSSISVMDAPSARSLYLNLIHIVGDRWTANVIALAFHGLKRFDDFHRELPVATNILADRIKFLVEEGIFEAIPYEARLNRFEYHLSEKGMALFPWFLTLLHWGDKWCDPENNGRPMRVIHTPCEKELRSRISCSACGGVLKAHEVEFTLEDPSAV